MPGLAKTTIPSLPQTYLRQRLFDLFDEYKNHPALWVSAPPGAGKTTAIASHLSRQNVAPVWIRCDEGDSDLATLFHYLGVAVAGRTGSSAHKFPVLVPEYRANLPVFARRFFRDLFSALTSPFVIVLDNYQEIGVEPSLHEVMQCAVEELPAEGRIFFVSRTEPPSPFSRIRANDQMAIVDAALLRFDQQEAEEMIRLRLGDKVDNDQVRRIAEQSQGWAAGMVLLSALGASPARRLNTGGKDLQTVFDYFASEIFARLDVETKDILVSTALLPMTTASMGERISGQPNTARTLNYLYQNSYFTFRDARKEPVYHYHPLFREFLLKHGEQYYSSERLSFLRAAAVALLRESGQIEAAIEISRFERSWDVLSDLIKSHGNEFLQQGRYALIKGWLDGIEEDVLGKYPWLRYWRGVSNMPFAPHLSQKDFAASFEDFDRNKDAPGVYRSWSVMVEAIRIDATGDNSRIDPWISRFDSLLEAYPNFPDPAVESEAAFGMFSALYLRAPQDPRLFRWKNRAIELTLEGGNPHHRSNVIQWAVIHDLLRGDHSRAALYMTVLRTIEQSSLGDPLIVSAGRFCLAYYLARTGEFDDSLKAVDEGLAITSSSGAVVWNYQLLAHGTTAAISKGDRGYASSLLKQMEAFAAATSGFAPMYYHTLAAWHDFSQNNASLARKHAEEAVSIANRTNIVLFDGITSYGLAQVLWHQKEHDEARKLLAVALGVAKRIESRILEHMCRMVEADFEFDAGNEARAVSALATGLQIGKDERYINFTFWMPPLMARMCAQAIARDIEPEYAAYIVRKRHLVPPYDDVEDWPWPVRIFTLDHFLILVDGESLPFSRKMPKKLMSLLKAIIAFGGQDVPIGRLVDALWSDQDADIGHEAMEKAVQRLRKMIGDDALFLRGGRVSLNPKLVWVDAWAFERLLSKGNSITSARATKATSMYRQNFLSEEEDAAWILTMRERLRAMFIQAVQHQGKESIERGDFQSALTLYLNALAVDSLAEEIYQGALSCYLESGRYAEGLALFRRLRQTLSITLGISPSDVTEEIHQKILSRERAGKMAQS
jgi:LuxR family maltose regulon positive regulatory protein